MKRVGVWALALALVAASATAQVEIKGLTIAPPDHPGKGGIMLKSLLSARLPGEISQIVAFGDQVFVRLDGKDHRVGLRNGELFHERASKPDPSQIIELVISGATDLDGDGKREGVRFESSPARLIVLRNEGAWREVASAPGYYWHGALEFIDVARIGRPQILAISEKGNCLRALTFKDDVLTDIGSLSCGGAIIGKPISADMDGDGRSDLIVARQPDRIEIFLR